MPGTTTSANTAFDINSQTIQFEEQLGSEALATAVLRGTWSGYTVAVKKLVGERVSTSQLEELREELKPLRYGARLRCTSPSPTPGSPAGAIDADVRAGHPGNGRGGRTVGTIVAVGRCTTPTSFRCWVP